MRIALLVFGFVMISAAPVRASDMPSLFFTPAEITAIETPQAPVSAPTDIQLGAVLYYGRDNWSIWLDGVRMSPETRRADLQIINVRPDRVTLQLVHGMSAPITLRPHQTWQASSGKIIEGTPN